MFQLCPKNDALPKLLLALVGKLSLVPDVTDCRLGSGACPPIHIVDSWVPEGTWENRQQNASQSVDPTTDFSWGDSSAKVRKWESE